MATTWTTTTGANKSSNVTISGGNEVATTTSGTGVVRATNPFATKNSCECLVNSDPNFSVFGISTSAFSVTTQTGGKFYGVVDAGGGQVIILDFTTFVPVGSPATGTLAANDRLTYELNGTTLYVRKNGSNLIGNAAAGTGGVTISSGTYYPTALLDSSSGSVSATLDADSPTYSPSTGYTIIGGGSGSQTLTGTLYSDTDSFGAGTITRGPVTLTGTLFTDSDSFGAGTVTPRNTLTGTLFTDTDAFGAGSISVGPVTLTGTLFTDGDSFGSGVVSQSGSTQTLTGTLFSDSDAFGSGVITTGPVTLTGTLFSDTDSFGAGTITRGAVTLTGTLFSDSDSFGAGTVSVGPVTLTGTLYQDADQFGAGSLSVGPVTITGTLYSDPASFGAGSVSQVSPQTITGTLFVDGDTFGEGRFSAAGGLHGSSPRTRRRGRVGRLDEELRQRLLAEEEDRIAAQIATIEQDDDPEPADYVRLAELETALAINKASMMALGQLEIHAAAQMQAEAARIAEDEDEEAALEALLLAA